jgi:hypothetical protein
MATLEPPSQPTPGVQGQHSENSQHRIGQPFNPYRMFAGIFIPEAIARDAMLSPGAKLCYGRLCRYAGVNGHCYPAVPTLAAEIGVDVRQAQRYLTELESARLINRVHQPGRPSRIQFLWHMIFESCSPVTGMSPVTQVSPVPATDRSPRGCHIRHPKRGFKESLVSSSHIQAQPTTTTGAAWNPELRRHAADWLRGYLQRSSGKPQAKPDETILGRILACFDGPDDFDLNVRDLDGRRVQGIRSYAWFVADAQNWRARRAEVAEEASRTAAAKSRKSAPAELHCPKCAGTGLIGLSRGAHEWLDVAPLVDVGAVKLCDCAIGGYWRDMRAKHSNTSPEPETVQCEPGERRR